MFLGYTVRVLTQIRGGGVPGGIENRILVVILP
jgi:hypothetical protein